MTIPLSQVLSGGQEKFVPAKRTKNSSPFSGTVKLPEGSLLPSDPDVKQTLLSAAEKYKINPALLMALAQQESGYRADAVGPETPYGTAKGMLQFIDSTARSKGIDPFNYAQAADAAAGDLAREIATKGVEWAVAHHHAGPNPKQHGPKTAQYTAEVLAKAQTIARELGIDFQVPDSTKPDFSNVTSKKTGIPLSAVLSAPASTERTAEEDGPESLLDTAKRRAGQLIQSGPLDVELNPDGTAASYFDAAKGALNLTLGPAQRTIERGWEGIQDAINRDTKTVTLTDEELRREWDERGLANSPMINRAGMNFRQWADQNRTRQVSATSSAQEEAEWTQRLKEHPEDEYLLPKRLSHLRQRADDSKFAPADTFQGVMQRVVANHKNPLDLMLQDSIPANVVTYLFTLPETERKKFDQARQLTQALESTSNPEGKSPEELELANAAIDEWKARTNPSIVRSWQEFWQASKEDPSQVLQGFSEALFADPEMALAPVGAGLAPLRAARLAGGTTLKATSIARRAERVVDKILDAGTLTAALNVSAGAAQNLATEGEINSAEVKLNAAMGYLIGGSIGAVFMKGAKARMKTPEAHRAEGTFDDAMRDMAESEVELEARAREVFDRRYEEMAREEQGFGVGEERTPLQRQIAALILGEDRPQGLTSRSPNYPKSDPRRGYNEWVDKRRKEVRDWFKNNADYADYQKFVAEARLRGVEELAAAAQSAARERADGAWGVTPEDAAARSARMAEEFDKALEARNAAEQSQEVGAAMEAARAEDQARNIARKLDAEDTFYAALSEDAPTIKQVEAKIKRREANLRIPKWQRGSADPETLARIGVVGAGAAAGLALFPEDEKLAGGLLGGLAGLVVPAGGSVLSRLRQAGAVSSDGQIFALMKAGKLANKLEEGEIRARDRAWVEGVRAGDQEAFKSLYETYKPQLVRFAKKFVGDRESTLAKDAEDIVQEAFTQAYNKITKDPDFEIPDFYEYINKVVNGHALKALRDQNRLKRKANIVQESQSYREDLYEGDRGSGRSILDETTGVDDYSGEVIIDNVKETPELVAMREEAVDIIRQALDGMSEQPRKLFTMVNLEHYTPEEAAQQLGMNRDAAYKALKRAENTVRRSVEENRRKFGEPADTSTIRAPRGQRGESSPDDLRRVAAIAATATAAGTAGYFLSDGDLWKTSVSALLGGPALYALGTGKLRGSGNVIKGELGGANPVAVAIRSLDYRLKDLSESIYGLAKKHGKQELQEIKRYNDATGDFTQIFRTIPKDVQATVVKALSTRQKPVINKVLEQVGGKEFVQAFDKVRVMLDEVEDNLVNLGLIKKTEKDYFPFRVKDLDGLKQAVGKEAASEIDSALSAAQRKLDAKEGGRKLTEIERDIIINKVLEPYLGKPISAHTPGFAKARTIQVIDEKLQPFYHDPISALNSYGVQAIKYIERAKFFGRHLKMRKDGSRMVADIGRSIGELVGDLKAKGEITDDQAVQLAGMLQDRFNGGEMASSSAIQGAKNLTNAALLGHVASAAVQIGDIFMQAGAQGLGPTLRAARRMITRDKLTDLKNFGLTEHVAHEFLSDGWTRRVSDWSFKWGGFRAIDHVGKNFGLNAAIERMFQDAQTPQGIMRLSDKFQRVFPEDFDKALSALKKGQVNESVELMAFAELTRTQPITSWELPQLYQRMPNGRLVYHLQTFSLRVMNMVYEEALRDIASMKAGRVLKGSKRLLTLGAILGVQGVASDKIKDVLAGKPVELSPEEIPLNALAAMGMNIYDYNRIADKGPLQGVLESKTPAVFRMSEQLWNEPERSVRFIPVVGRATYDRGRDYFEQRRKERRKREGYKMEITVPAKETSERSGSSRRSSRSRRSGRRER